MYIELRAKSIELTDAMKNHFHESIESLDKYSAISNSDKFRGEVHVYGPGKIKVTIHGQLKKSKRVEAVESGSDFYKVVAKVTRDIEKQLRKISDKMHDHSNKNSLKHNDADDEFEE